MPRGYSRTRRVGEQMQRELALIIQQEVKDPRLGMVTVSGVEVSRDLAYAKVFVSVMGAQTQRDVSLEVLHKAAGAIRFKLAHRMRIRTVPELRFVYDETLDRSEKLTALIDAAVAKEKESGDK